MAERRAQNVVAIVGYYEILAGSLGVVMMIWAAVHRDSVLPGGPWFASAPFVATIVVAIQLIQGRPRAIAQLVVLNALQIFFFSVGGFVWKFTSGLQLSIAMDAQAPQVFAGFASTFFVGVRAYKEPFVVGMNIAPALLILVLLRLARDTKPGG